jgi:hypothetical protein
MERLNRIREGAMTLFAVVEDAKDKAAAENIREASHEAILALRGYLDQTPESAVRLTVVVTHFRQQVKPLVDEICDRHGIAPGDRPKIVPDTAGESNHGTIWSAPS